MRLSYKFTPWCIATPTRDLSILPRTKTCLGQSEWSHPKVQPARKKCFTLLMTFQTSERPKKYLRKSHQLKDLWTGLPTGQRHQLANFLPSTLVLNKVRRALTVATVKLAWLRCTLLQKKPNDVYLCHNVYINELKKGVNQPVLLCVIRSKKTNNNNR